MENKIEKIQKRDGSIVGFDQSRITDAIFKALTASGQGDGKKSKKLSDKVVQILNRRFKKEEIPHVEQIQDIVEEVLILEGLVKAAKAYILYREQRRRIREAIKVSEEAVDRLDQYIERLDWEVQENANMAFSLQGLNHYGVSYIVKKYWLNKIYPPEIREANESGDLHLHNLDTLGPYCVGWDLYDLLMKGFGGVPGKIESKPAKHFNTALMQCVNFLYTLQGECAGAVSFSNFDTLLAPFIRYDNLDYRQVKQALQEFLFNLSIPTRVGFQSLDWDELVVIKHRGKIKFVEIGKLVDEEFEKNSHRIIEQHPSSFAVQNYDDYYALSFDSQGKAVWAKIKAFIRHKVPKGSKFIKIGTNRGEVKVSPAHSLFAFEKFDSNFNPKPVKPYEVEIAKDYRHLNEKNHFLALSKLENNSNKEELDLVELIDEFPQIHKNVFVKINPTHTLSQIKQKIIQEYQAIHPFYVDFGIRDRKVWKEWLKRRTIRYDIWRKFGEKKKETWFKLKNSKIWYPRILKGKILENFVKLSAWYVGEGHKGISVPLFISQADPKNVKEILKILQKLRALGEIQKNQGYSPKRRKTKAVRKIAGKGLLSEIISLSCGIMAFNKVGPWYIFELSPKYQKIFIRELLKGEAKEYKNYWDLSTTSRKLTSSLSLLLAQNNIRFSVYTEKRQEKNKNWRNQWIIRIFKENFPAKKEYKVGDFEARVCLGKEEYEYKNEFEYDISVDLPQENFVGGVGLLVFHNTPFTNITLDLKPSLVYAKLPVIIGGKPQDKTYSEFEEEMKIFDKALYEVYMEGDAKGRPFHFPIPTINITKDFPWEEPTFDGIFEASAKYGTNYFANYINSEMKPEDVRSMCKLPSTQIIYKNAEGEIAKTEIRRIVEDFIRRGNPIEILINGKFKPVKDVIKLKLENEDILKVTLENGLIDKMTLDHPSLIIKHGKLEIVESRNLKVGDEFPIAKYPYEGELGDFNLGRLVGLYVGDGWISHEGATLNYVFGIREKKLIEFVEKEFKERFAAPVTIYFNEQHKYCRISVASRAVVELIKEYVRGENSLTKRINSKTYGRSIEFRKGVLIGVLESDGSIVNKKDLVLHLGNKKLILDLLILARSLGVNTTYFETKNRTGEKRKMGFTLRFTSDYPEWLARYFNLKKGKSPKYKDYGDFYGVKIKKIEKIKYTGYVYDFEIKSQEHAFQLANGIITHNCCRLRLDLKELHNRGGGGLFGAGSKTGCYDEKTEILTENGWKFFKDLTLEDSVFTFTKDNKIELHHPIRLFEYDYEGKMIRFKSRAFDLLVTPNHRMVVDHKYKGKRMFVEAKDFKPYQHYIPKGGIWEGEEKEWFVLPPVAILGGAGPESKFSEEELQTVRQLKNEGKTIYQIAESFNCSPVTIFNVCTKEKYGNREGIRIRYEAPPLKIKMDDWLKFFGFWLAEGSTDNEKVALDHGYRVIISQKNKEKREEIKEVLNCLPFNYSEEKDTFVICNKQLWSYLRQFGSKYTKFIPKEIKNLSKRQLKILFDWMVKRDGHVRKTNGQINYWTASKKLADDLQEIILKLGWHATIKERKRKISQIKGREVKTNVVYQIGVHRKTKHFTFTRKERIKDQIREVYYKGKVYCCEVPNHTVYVRRNGKATWCGNSIGVVTINLPRIGYLSKTKKEFFERLTKVMDLAKESLEIKRKVLENLIEKGLYPYSRYYLQDIKQMRGKYWANHFSTIGLVGMNECLLNFMGENIASKRGRKFALEVLDFMREKLIKYQEETGNIYNLEQTPAESTAFRFALKDKERYPDIVTAGTKKVPYYTNSSQLPVNFTDDVFYALKLQDELQSKYTGGSVFHIFLGERMQNGEGVKRLVKKVFENFKLPYITITPTFSICPVHGYIPGEHFFCPKCTVKQPCEIYTRIVGYYRPVQQWNTGKQQEFKQRKEFKIKETFLK